MQVTLIGVGYVGLVTGACLAELGHDVLCFDVDQSRISLINDGSMPIYEPGIEELVRKNVEHNRLRFTHDPLESVQHGRIQMIAVGTPGIEDGSADLQHVLAAARVIGRHMQEYKLIVNKSTVPVGTADRVREAVSEELNSRKVSLEFDVASNPEFLREGTAIRDFWNPDRIVIGVDSAHADDDLRSLYALLKIPSSNFLTMSTRSAELSKYAANAMLAARISFMNELSLLSNKLSANIGDIQTAIGMDPRIGRHFLRPGVGYGGSCLPKDVKALVKMARDNGIALGVLEAVETANERQKYLLIEKVINRFGPDLTGLTFAIWGLAFKPETDDTREAPSRVIVEELISRNAEVRGYDPALCLGSTQMRGFPPALRITDNLLDATSGTDAILLLTEWDQFKSADLSEVAASVRQRIIFDGRNALDVTQVAAANFEYFAIGHFDPIATPRAR